MRPRDRIVAPVVRTKHSAEYRRMVLERRATAAECIGILEPGQTAHLLTHGQFSFVDMIDAVVAQAEPAVLYLSAWTGIEPQYRRLGEHFHAGRITGARILLDRSSYGKEPAACEYIARTFGADNIRTSRNHCKLAVLGPFSIAGSMNLNMNPRIENADITRDPVLADFYRAFFDYCFASLDPVDWRGNLPGGTEIPAEYRAAPPDSPGGGDDLDALLADMID